jgi:hypothetical protein
MVLLLSLLAPGADAAAAVFASPAYQNLGSVTAGSTAVANVMFFNTDQLPVDFFNVNCMDAYGVFQCSSNCFRLEPFGSCSVMVWYRPRFGDNRVYFLDMQGVGSNGAFAMAQVQAIDRPKN